ncbi:MAG TPA: ATP-binding protein [Hydrogenophaga sp.]|uniref:hybrid sensor histidine kinase/response regulator n=1 Tax=Hydrogenophaga sp. TaxID=1904254 RepID=UPI002C0662C1|nr:ATP-binding protein [Hydrogenophaga sp.]HMN92948.1 ATP-binding protein [Hydrogenophaga sp.]HMP09749.1 ATP-binding protein [Hydrogenophaga sp.]
MNPEHDAQETARPSLRRLPIGRTLVVAMVLAALTPALLVAWLLSHNSAESINRLAEDALSQAAHRIDVGALAHLGESHTVVNALVPPVFTTGAEAARTRNWLVDTASFEVMAYALTQQSPNVPYLYLGTEDGSFFGLERESFGYVVRTIRPGDSGRRHFQIEQPGDRSRLIRQEETIFDPRKRPWYQLAVATGRRTFTDVYRSAVKDQFDLTLAHPIMAEDGRTLLGVMAVDMSLARLGELIRSTRISDNAVTYLVDSRGLMVASSVDEPLSRVVENRHQLISPLQSSDPLVRESFTQLRAQHGKHVDTGLAWLNPQTRWLDRLGLQSNRLIALQRPFGRKYDLDWQLIVVAPESDFTSSVMQARQWALAGTALLTLLCAWAAYAVGRGLSRQFQQLNAAATAVGAGQVPPIEEASRFAEVHHLSRVMHDSARSLQTYNREIRQKNEQLQEAAQLLERRVEQRTAELAASREEALAAVKAKAGFLAVMSHEIRTPLNGVVGMGELLRGTPLNAAQSELMDVLRVSSEQLLSVVDDILDFSRIESGKLVLEDRPFDLHAAIGSAVDMVRIKAQEKGLHLSMYLAATVPEAIRGDVTRLRQVLLNLLANAVKFTARGEVTLRVWSDAASSQEASVLHFSVTDTGVGIRPDRLGDLFQPFAQGDTSTTRVYGGTGLGLMICKHLVELMGGRIGVSSEPGAGSTFRFELPVHPVRLSDVEPDHALPTPVATGRHRVLAVDDHPGNLKVIAAMLERLGYPHETCEDGRQALDRILQARQDGHPFALLLLDLHMPGLDGIATARAVAGALQDQAPRMVGLSASSLGEDRQRCLDAGMVAYLTKPLELDALARTLADLSASQPEGLEGLPAEAVAGTGGSPPNGWEADDTLALVDHGRWHAFSAFDDSQHGLRREVVGGFLAELEPRLQCIRQAWQACDNEAWRLSLHHLKGAASNVGAARLAALCQKLSGHQPDGSTDPRLHQSLEALATETAAALEQLLESR